jgi:hypothetical protein
MGLVEMDSVVKHYQTKMSYALSFKSLLATKAEELGGKPGF